MTKTPLITPVLIAGCVILMISFAVRASFGLPPVVQGAGRRVAAGTNSASMNLMGMNPGLRLVVPAQPALTARAGPRCG